MLIFVCLIASQEQQLPPETERPYETLMRSHGLPFLWRSLGPVKVLLGGDRAPEHLCAVREDSVAVGIVRLDNRQELEQWTCCEGAALSDLQLIQQVIVQHGTKSIRKILGDFSFVVWNTQELSAIAACDSFAVKKLYYSQRNGITAFASRAEAIAIGADYDVRSLAHLVGTYALPPDHTVYSGVRAVPAASMVVLDRTGLRVHRYWSVMETAIDGAWARAEQEAVSACRQHLIEAVRSRLTGDPDVWAQLSGGLDSSSVVSIAQWLWERGSVAHGLAGTVTYVDGHGTGADERSFSDSVVSRWRVPNKTIVDPPFWYDNACPLPRTDQPTFDLPFFPRDHRAASLVRQAGGRVLLTGGGGDALFTGNMFFFADWLIDGRLLEALREMLVRAAMGRASFWELAYRNAVLPLLPRAARLHLIRESGQLPPWLTRSAVRKYGLEPKAAVHLSYNGRIGHKYHGAIVAGIAALPGYVPAGAIEDLLDVRHPYLARPLVEFALSLPPELCVRPYERKWVLRQAMQDLLPDTVRTRVGKGVTYGLLGWSLTKHRALLEPLVRGSILADLGVVDQKLLSCHFQAAPRTADSRMKLHGALQHTLSIEAWLQLRSGQWPPGESNSIHSQQMQQLTS